MSVRYVRVALAWLALAGLLEVGGISSAMAAAPTPPVPDFNGVWLIVNPPATLRTNEGDKPPLLPDAAKLFADRTALRPAPRKALDPTSRCLPPGLPRTFLQKMPFEVLQDASSVNVLFQWNRLVRVVDLGIRHDQQTIAGPTYFGHAVGRFTSTELLIDTVGLVADTWLDDAGLPHGDKLHLTERWWLDDGGQRLNIDFEVNDPDTYAAAWNFTLSFRRLPRTTAIEEDVCVERQGLVKSGTGR